MLRPCIANSRNIDHPTLSEVDWFVVGIARKDGPLSLNPDSLWARISRDLLGLPVGRRMTNDTLEALRRFCVRAWFWNEIRTSDLQRLTEAGYSHVHGLQILAHVTGERGYCPSIEENAA